MDEQNKTYWHGPFFRGIKLVLHGLPLRFHSELQLSEEALKIDALVIKHKETEIGKDIGRLFRGHNLLEFKSESDSFSVRDYSKIIGYAGLYSSFKNVPITDVTFSIVLAMFPRELVKFLESERGLKVIGVYDGIYYVQGDIIPVQILETKKLSRENLFLRNLRSNLTPQELTETLQAFEAVAPIDKRDIYLDCLIKANWNKFREVAKMIPNFKEVFLQTAEEDGWLDDWFDKRIVDHDFEKNKQIVRKLLQLGRPIEEISQVTELSVDTIKSLIDNAPFLKVTNPG